MKLLHFVSSQIIHSAFNAPSRNALWLLKMCTQSYLNGWKCHVSSWIPPHCQNHLGAHFSMEFRNLRAEYFQPPQIWFHIFVSSLLLGKSAVHFPIVTSPDWTFGSDIKRERNSINHCNWPLTREPGPPWSRAPWCWCPWCPWCGRWAVEGRGRVSCY